MITKHTWNRASGWAREANRQRSRRGRLIEKHKWHRMIRAFCTCIFILLVYSPFFLIFSLKFAWMTTINGFFWCSSLRYTSIASTTKIMKIILAKFGLSPWVHCSVSHMNRLKMLLSQSKRATIKIHPSSIGHFCSKWSLDENSIHLIPHALFNISSIFSFSFFFWFNSVK